MNVLQRNNVHVTGNGPPMVFVHGFGCDQHMWTEVASRFEPDFRVILFDHVGAGRSDLTAYDPEKYATLDGYADDVVEIGRAGVDPSWRATIRCRWRRRFGRRRSARDPIQRVEKRAAEREGR